MKYFSPLIINYNNFIIAKKSNCLIFYVYPQHLSKTDNYENQFLLE